VRDVRVIPAGEPTRDTIPPMRPAKVDVEGLKNTYTRPNVRPLTPSEARAASENRYPDESTGADALYKSGRIEIRSEKQVQEERRSPADVAAAESAERVRADAGSKAAAAIRDEFHAHAAKLQSMAAEAKGNAAREARVTEAIRQSSIVGAELKQRGLL
jgi:hypothetical protein